MNVVGILSDAFPAFYFMLILLFIKHKKQHQMGYMACAARSFHEI